MRDGKHILYGNMEQLFCNKDTYVHAKYSLAVSSKSCGIREMFCCFDYSVITSCYLTL